MRTTAETRFRDHEAELKSDAEVYISTSEVIGFLGTLLGIIIAFGAIPAMQLPTADKLSRASVMSVVTGGLVLAFSTTLIAQSVKLAIIWLHRSNSNALRQLKDKFIAFTEDFVHNRQ